MNLIKYFLIAATVISITPNFASAARKVKPARMSCESFFALLDGYNDCLKDGIRECRNKMDLAVEYEFQQAGIGWLVIRIARCSRDHHGTLLSPLATSLTYNEPEITEWLRDKMQEHGFKCHLRLFNTELKKHNLQTVFPKKSSSKV